MNICPNCGAALAVDERYCPRCGAAARSTKTRSMNIILSRRDARRGCVRQLRYPGAPGPIKVRLPGALHDGSQIYVNELPFLTGEGQVVQGALRLDVTVKKSRVLPTLMGLALFAALFCALLLFTGERMPKPGFIRALPFVSTETPPPPSLPTQSLPSPTQPPETPAPSAAPSHLSPMQQQALSIIPCFEQRYFLMQLDERQLENFCALYIAVRDFHSQCSFPQELSRDELLNLMLLLSYECPELLQFSAATETNYMVDEQGRVLSVQLEMCMSQEEYKRQYELCSAVASELARQTQGLSESEKELFAYDYLASSCFYDFDAPWSASAYGALVEGRAKCDGISLAMKWLCEEMGLKCMVIAGTQPGQSVGHAWNLIQIGGVYYDLDVTNDVRTEEQRVRFYGAFNVSGNWIRAKYPENFSFSGFLNIPAADSMDMSYHALRGSYVPQGADPQQTLFRRLENAGEDEAVYIQFESTQQYQSFINDINHIMSQWDGLSKGSFNYSLSHLDEFQVCCLKVSFL